MNYIETYKKEIKKESVVDISEIYLELTEESVSLVIESAYQQLKMKHRLPFADLTSPAEILTFHRRVLLTSHPVMSVVSIDGKATVNNPEIGTPGQVQHLINLYYNLIEDCRNNNKIRSL